MSSLATAPAETITRLPTQLPAARSTDVPPEKTMRERADRDLNARRLITNKSRDQINQFLADDDDVWENHAFEYTVNTVGLLVAGPPSVRVTDGGVEDDDTRLLQDALRSQIVRQKMVRTFRQLATDVPFDFPVALVTLQPTHGAKYRGGSVVPMEPVIKRLGSRRYGCDIDAPLYGKPRHQFHIVVKRRSELLEAQDDGQPAYDPVKVRGVQQGPLSALRAELSLDGITVSEDDKDLVVLYEIFVPDLFDDGGWITMAPDADGGVYIREPRPAVCCQGGPYAVGGLHFGPDQVYPTAPLAVTRRHVDELNAFHKQITEDAKSLKRITFVNGQQPGVIANIQTANSGDVLSIPGWGGQVLTQDIGGVNPGLLEHVEGRKQLLDRVSGLSDTERGNVTPGATATGIDRAATYTNMRRDIAISSFTEYAAELLTKYTDLMGAVKSVCFPFAYQDPTPGGADGRGGNKMIRSTFYGGSYTGHDGYPWLRNYQCEIEPNSMPFVNKGALRNEVIAFQDQVLKLVTASAPMPFLKLKAMIDDVAATMNISQASTRYVDFVMKQAIEANARAMAQQVLSGLPAQGGAASPASGGGGGDASGLPPSPAQLGAMARQEA